MVLKVGRLVTYDSEDGEVMVSGFVTKVTKNYRYTIEVSHEMHNPKKLRGTLIKNLKRKELFAIPGDTEDI